jgi:hypothetical protein
MQWSFTYEVFVAAREGNISNLRYLFDAKLASPIDRTIASMGLLESALASCVAILCKDAAMAIERRRQPSQLRLKKLFDTIDFLLCLGLRL